MSTRIIIFVILELLLLYALFGSWLIRKLSPGKRRLRLLCRDYASHLRRVVRHDRDLLPPATVLSLQELGQRARDTSRARQMEGGDIRLRMHEIEQQSKQLLAYRQGGTAWIRETLEVMVVALTLAFAFRALFLQPFKIPTGSMEPTLYGVHFVECEAMRLPALPRRAIDFIHFSNRYVNQVVQRPGPYQGFRSGRGLPMLNTTVVRIAGLEYTLPGDLEAVRKQTPQIWQYERHRAAYLNSLAQNQPIPPPASLHFTRDEVLARGYLRSGDHVFVNRFTHNFTEIDRGDIVVFLTDGLRDADDNPLRGRFFIKRLVGLPGDRLKIDADNYLHVKPRGQGQFKVLDESFHPAFARIYSGLGGYHGYVAEMPSKVRVKHSLATAYTVPDRHYFMLGDNSRASQDSRFWGPVPRANIVGRATIAWWPLSRRWGFIDRAEPEPFPTPEISPASRIE